MRNGAHATVDETEGSSFEFLIRHDKFDLRIFLAPSPSLFLHEETIPNRVSQLKESLLRDGVVKDPVIIDAESRVVLDGMHRVAALRQMHCTCMPVCAVDYANPAIRVGAWFRVVTGPVTATQFRAAISQFHITMESFSTGATDITANPALAILFAGGQYYRLTSTSLNFAEMVKATELCTRELHLDMRFETERDAIQRLLGAEANAVITLPKFSKAAIREAGQTGRLFPPKVTRHIIPARPLRVNVPVADLAEEKLDFRNINQAFVEQLRRRRIIRNSAGTFIDGRRYEEETFIFGQDA